MTCRYLAEGADWSHGGCMTEFCELSGEHNPDCTDCPDYVEEDE